MEQVVLECCTQYDLAMSCDLHLIVGRCQCCAFGGETSHRDEGDWKVGDVEHFSECDVAWQHDIADADCWNGLAAASHDVHGLVELLVVDEVPTLWCHVLRAA